MDLRALLKILAVRAIQFVAALAALFLLLGVFAESFWIFDILAHFRGQYCAAFLVCGLALLVLRRKKSGSASLAAGLALAVTFLPSREISAAPANPARMKLISFNVLKTNPRRGEIRDFLAAENADVVFLTEVTDLWNDDVEELRKTYPYKVASSRRKNHGIVLLSKHPFIEETMHRTKGARPWAEAVIAKDGDTYRVAGLHTIVPWGMACSDIRNDQLLAIASHLAGQPRAILCGDLNITPFSPWFQKALTRGGLVDSSRHAGFSPTWMRGLPFFAIPIDHVLLSEDLQLISRRVGPSLGSDHSPLIVEVAPAQPPSPGLAVR